MRLLVAPDSFKGTLSALEVCQIVQSELADRFTVISHPLADGGEGTLAAIASSLEGSEWISLEVCSPLVAKKVMAQYLWLAPQQEAFVEMAQASGLTLLDEAERNPELTTTYGTGQLIAHAIAKGAKKIYLAIGGSATNDAGIGMLMALGWQFLNAQAGSVGFGGKALKNIVKIIAPQEQKLPPITLLCDVTNPLYGEQGAAYIYAQQKGADSPMIERLDQGLRHLAEIVKQQYQLDLNFPGAGAAGGLGAGAKFGLQANITTGFQAIADLTGLEEKVSHCDVMITGEGQLDSQSLQGKVISGMVELGKKYDRPIIVITGVNRLLSHPDITKIFSLSGEDFSLEDCITFPQLALQNRCKTLKQHLLVHKIGNK